MTYTRKYSAGGMLRQSAPKRQPSVMQGRDACHDQHLARGGWEFHRASSRADARKPCGVASIEIRRSARWVAGLCPARQGWGLQRIIGGAVVVQTRSGRTAFPSASTNATETLTLRSQTLTRTSPSIHPKVRGRDRQRNIWSPQIHRGRQERPRTRRKPAFLADVRVAQTAAGLASSGRVTTCWPSLQENTVSSAPDPPD